jgi:hypothetical protein
MIGNSLNLHNANKNVWSCSGLAGFSNKRMMNKINEFEFIDLPSEVNGGEIIQRNIIGKIELRRISIG